MAEFRMLVGLPGCGKSTYSNNFKLEYNDYNIHSSDAIRAEFDIFGSDHNNEVFTILHKRVIDDLKNGKNVIYDATNLTRKSRRSILDKIKNIDCTKICVLFITPVEVCKERNALRTGVARVPDEVYDRMLKSFNVPTLEEGFDHIQPEFLNASYKYKFNLPDMNIDQDNPYHTSTVQEHMNEAYELVKKETNNLVILTAAKYHDIGKAYTKSFTDSKGNSTKYAHFYNHENYGAYIYLIYWAYSDHMLELKYWNALHVAQLINWHMAPLNRWKQEKTVNKDRYYISDTLYNEILMLNRADINAH